MSRPETPHTPECWGAASGGYATKIAPRVMGPFVDEIVDCLGVDASTTVIEVAAGSGALTLPLAGKAASVLATDFAPEMLTVLRERLEGAGITNVEVARMDGQDLDVEDASFDRAACSFGLMLFPDRAAGFSELARVLRSRGRAVVTGWSGPDRFESFGLFMAGIARAFPDMPPPDEPPAVFSLADLDRFRTEMTAAGFEGVEVGHMARELEVADYEELWAMLTAGAPPVQVLFDRIGEEGKERLRDGLGDVVRETYGDGPITVTNVATIGSGDVR